METNRLLLIVAGIAMLAVSLPHLWLGTFGVPELLAYPLLILFIISGAGLLTGKHLFAYVAIIVIFVCFGVNMTYIGPAGFSNIIFILMFLGNVLALILIAAVLIRTKGKKKGR